MVDKEGSSQVPESKASEVDMTKYVPLAEVEEERRRWQSSKDKEAAVLSKRERERGREEGRQEVLNALNADPEFAEFRDRLAVQQRLAKADYYEQREREQREAEEYRRQLVETFNLSEGALDGVTDRREMYTLALHAHDAKLKDEILASLGKGEEEEESEDETPPDIPVSRAPSPDVANMSVEEWETQLRDLASLARDQTKSRSERKAARQQWIILQGKRPRSSARRARL